jgi:hypothetical protein
MKLQRSTVVLVATALVLGGIVLFTEAQQSGRGGPATAQGDTGTAPVFDFEEADVVALAIDTADQTVAFKRDDEGFWQMTEPEAHPAEEAAIAFLLSRLTTDGLRQTTTIDDANQEEFGLQVPFATIELALADGTTHRLVLGAADFSGQNYYALIDPETLPLTQDMGDVDVAIVTENIRNGVDRPLEEWQAVIDTPAEAPDSSETPAPEDATDTVDDADPEASNGSTANEPPPEQSGTNSEGADAESETFDKTDEEDDSTSNSDSEDAQAKELSESETDPITVPLPETSDTAP